MNSEDRVSAVKGIGAKTESHLARIGIYTVGDFIEHYPREYHTYDVPIPLTIQSSIIAGNMATVLCCQKYRSF